MTFETDVLPLTEDPSTATIEAALRSIEDGFAVLARSDQEYIQATSVGAGSYLIERREGSADRHYQTRDNSIGIERVVTAFLAYHAGGSAWTADFNWAPLTL